MNTYYTNTHPLLKRIAVLFRQYKIRRGMAFGLILVGALAAFEIFNYTTTDYALTDLLGTSTFLGLRWAMVLSLAFCGMDFAGIARLFTPTQERHDHTETWYLLGAWFLAATMNAMLTWWSVSVSLLHHQSLGNEILGRQQLLTIVPVFVSTMVWLIRILLIGTFSLAGDRLFSQVDKSLSYPARPVTYATQAPRPAAAKAAAQPARMISRNSDYDQRPRYTEYPARPMVTPLSSVRPAPKPSATASAYNGNGIRAPHTLGGRSGYDR